MTNGKQPLLLVEGLEKRFIHEGKRIDVLRGVDVRLEEGEMCAVVGSSGAGKSTLLHVLGTLDRPTGGRILFQGEDTTRLSERRLAELRNRGIGFVFQFHHLLPEFTALENTMMPGLIQGRGHAEVEAEAVAMLAEVGLAERLRHKPGELSGGEQQRVALARALVLHPQLLLADEPTGNLDGHTAAAIHELFFEMNRRYGTTMILVTHNPGLAARMPRALRLEDGLLREHAAGEA